MINIFVCMLIILFLPLASMEKPIQPKDIEAQSKDPEFNTINAELRKQFPEMFADIPSGYKRTIVDSAIKKYKKLEKIIAAFEKLKQEDKYATRIFNLNALANFFGFELQYHAGYLHYARAVKEVDLTGMGYDFGLVTYKNLHRSIKDVKARIYKNQDTKKLIDQLEEKETRWIRYENLVLQELLIEQDLLNVYDQKEKALPLYNKLAEFLVQNYKIHLMPIDQDFYKMAVIFFKSLKDNPNLRTLVNNFKIRVEDNVIKRAGEPDMIMSLFVVYPAYGKDNAQQLLNNVYASLNNNVKGSGQIPRWNAKVTDLIFIAQGDGELKTDENKQYFEPNRVYYRSDITGKKENYHLIHPETGKEIV